MKVFDENGGQLFSQDSCTNAQIYNTPLGAKMFARVYRNVGDPYYKVFSLPGTNVPLVAKSSRKKAAGLPFPNPTQAEIQLPYQLSAGQVGTLTVVNSMGQQVATYKVDNAFTYLKFNTSTLAKGVYTYQVYTESERSIGQRFVVN